MKRSAHEMAEMIERETGVRYYDEFIEKVLTGAANGLDEFEIAAITGAEAEQVRDVIRWIRKRGERKGGGGMRERLRRLSGVMDAMEDAYIDGCTAKVTIGTDVIEMDRDEIRINMRRGMKQ